MISGDLDRVALLAEVRGRLGVMWVEPPGSAGWIYPFYSAPLWSSKRCRTGFTPCWSSTCAGEPLKLIRMLGSEL